MALAVCLAPGARTLVGWDEWILATISTRVARWWLPSLSLTDLIAPTGYSYPPFFFWLNGLLVFVFGPHPVVWRLVPAISEAACASLVFIIGRRTAGRWAGWTAGLLAVTAGLLSFHDTVSMDYLLCAWILLSMYLLLRAAEERRAGPLMWSLFFGSMACFTKYHGVVYLTILLLLAMIMPSTRKALAQRPWNALSAALALPLLLLVFELLVWRAYGFSKTHVAEVLRVLTWPSIVQEPGGEGFVRPQWHYYFVYCWHALGAPVCALGLLGACAALIRRRRSGLLILAAVALWMTWASVSELKNPRYALPAAYLFFVLAGVFVALLSKAEPGGRLVAGAALLAVVTHAGCGAFARTRDYVHEARRHEEVYRIVNQQTRAGAVVLAESVPFQAGGPVGIAPIKRRIIEPVTPDAFRRADCLVADELAYQLIRAGALGAQPGYLEERQAVLDNWRLLYDGGAGNGRVRVLARETK